MLILASGSPQRRAILTQLGVPFEVRVSGAEELLDGLEPSALALENARRKARAVAAGVGDVPMDEAGRSAPPVLGVDTVVVLDGRVYGKPADVTDARETLARLAGRAHTVISGLCLIAGDREERVAVAQTDVVFRPLSDAQLDAYVATGEWRGRAGGYAIQGRGALLVAEIHGDYFNVVGLPVVRLATLAPELFPV